MFKLDLEKAEESETKLPTSAGSQKKQENTRKTSTSASLSMLKPLTVWITTNCGKFFKRIPYHLTCLLRNLYEGQETAVKTGHETMDWFKIGKGIYTVEAIYCQYIVKAGYYHPAYLTYMQSTS